MKVSLQSKRFRGLSPLEIGCARSGARAKQRYQNSDDRLSSDETPRTRLLCRLIEDAVFHMPRKGKVSCKRNGREKEGKGRNGGSSGIYIAESFCKPVTTRNDVLYPDGIKAFLRDRTFLNCQPKFNYSQMESAVESPYCPRYDLKTNLFKTTLYSGVKFQVKTCSCV